MARFLMVTLSTLTSTFLRSLSPITIVILSSSFVRPIVIHS